MDFRLASEQLNQGAVTQEEIINQILNLPCVYGIYQDNDQLFCLDVINENNKEEIKVPLLYSNLEIAMLAVKEFKAPFSWHIAQWTDIQEALNICKSLDVEGVAFDSLPEGSTLNGLVIDELSLADLIELYIDKA